jgi:hypothetical protein
VAAAHILLALQEQAALAAAEMEPAMAQPELLARQTQAGAVAAAGQVLA